MIEIAEAFTELERGVQAAPMMSRWANSLPGLLLSSIPRWTQIAQMPLSLSAEVEATRRPLRRIPIVDPLPSLCRCAIMGTIQGALAGTDSHPALGSRCETSDR
jgi:hypothetical protein